MRRTRNIRRRDFGLLGILFLVSCLLFYEAYADVFIKEFAEEELNGLFPKGTAIKIGNIEGGVFRNLVCEDVELYQPRNNSGGLLLKRLEISYRVWHFLLKKVPLFPELDKENKIAVFFGERESVNGFLILEGEEEEFTMSGHISLLDSKKAYIKGVAKKRHKEHSLYDLSFQAGRDVNLTGYMDFIKKEILLDIELKKGTIEMRVEKESEEKTLIKGKINHIDFYGMDFVSEFDASITANADDSVNADLTFKNIFIGYNPFKDVEIHLSYDRSKAMLNIRKFQIGDEITGYGYLRHRTSYIFLKWMIKDLVLEDIFRNDDLKNRISGVMNANFTLKGPFGLPALAARLDVQNGTLGTLEYNSLTANLKGRGPLISLYDSKIRKDDGYIEIEGNIDLTKLKDNKAFDGIYYEADEKVFVWEGWSITKKEEDFLKAEKSLDNNLNLSFITYLENDKFEEDNDKSSEVGLEYKLDKDESLYMRFKEEDFIGLEHKHKF